MLGDPVIVGGPKEVEQMWETYSPLFAIFMSSTETNNTQSNEHIDDSIDGGRLELINCGQSATTMGTRDLIVSPYSTRLRPVTNLSKFALYRKIYLTKIKFYPLDSTLTGEAAQDAQIDTEIQSSLTSLNDAYAQSRFRFSGLPPWQPNFFRPSLSVNGGDDVFDTLSSSNFGEQKNNRGDLSIGPMLPYEYIPPVAIFMGRVANLDEAIRVYAGCGQLVEDTVANEMKVQRYPIHCYIEFMGVK
ncbi:MAG: hypothetical protein U0264_05245 [Candidatus Kapaibacterium sp.]